MVGCAVDRARLVTCPENYVASTNDPRGFADSTSNHSGLVASKCSNSSRTTEMSICSLVCLENHDPFDRFIDFDLIERFSDAGRVFSSDSKQNGVGTARTNEYSACFRVNIVEG